MSNGSFVLLQASVNEDLGDSVIELSPRQLEALGNPVIVRLQKMTETAPVKGKSRKTVHPGSKLLVETIENPLLDDDSCRLSATSISIITGATPIGSVGGAAACLRLSLVQRLAPHAFEKKTESEEQRLQQWQRAQLVVDMQTAMAKLTYDKEWYQSHVLLVNINYVIIDVISY